MSLLGELGAGTRLGLWGFGREGRATLAFLKDRIPGLTPTLLADAPFDPSVDLPVVTGNAATRAIASGGFEVIVKSPGISAYRPEIDLAREGGTRFTSSTNLWREAFPHVPVLAVTGTKGKSTTASLIAHLWKDAEPGMRLAGNVGLPLIEIETAPTALVLELSSYQTADLELAPRVAVLTNLYPEHLDWHRSTERYFADKCRLFELEPRATAVLNAADLRTAARFAGTRDARWFGGPEGWHVEPGRLLFGSDVRFNGTDWALPGDHNLQNLAAAMAALDAWGVDASALVSRAASFEALAHRLQVLGDQSGLTWIDDSISTTPESTLAALQALAGDVGLKNRPIGLILGGQERGQRLDGLAAALDPARHRVATVPDNGTRFAADLQRLSPDVQLLAAGDLEAAIAWLRDALPEGSIVLLSPAAPSYGRFKDFIARGEAFQRLAGLAPDV